MNASASSSSAWPTPRASEAGPDFAKASRSDTGMALPAVAVLWGTPRASDGEKGSPNQSFGAGGTPLPSQAASWGPAWPTPMARDHKGVDRAMLRDGNSRPLNEAVAHWPTPKVSDLKGADPARGENRSGKRHSGDGLATTTSQWQTPSVASAMGGQTSRSGDRKDELLLGGEAAALSSRLAPRTQTDGSAISSNGRTLNPRFVEALMAWAPGLSNCDCSATEFIQWREDMRSVLSRIGLPPEAPLAQPDLFG